MVLTQERLKYLLNYDPESGVWIWLNPVAHNVRRGDIAGRLSGHGYRGIMVDRERYYSSRLAFLYMTGEWPTDEVDHINRIKDDDRWCNLRPATRSQNCFNKATLKGELRCIKPNGNRFEVQVANQYLGLYAHLDDAKEARNYFLALDAGEFVTYESIV